MIERLDPSNLAVPAGREADIEAHIRSDYLIRSGMCPNGHGLMGPSDFGQECPKCHFSCNTLPELTAQ
ncbi:hypothetical protein [Roseateles cavernae]|uniref:hypothetical protein n=1 Tax=Roseateles cavernae TaxID=3153578 RepID=UPI0032E516DF